MGHIGPWIAAAVACSIEYITRQLVDGNDGRRHVRMAEDALEEEGLAINVLQSKTRNENVVKVVVQTLLEHIHEVQQLLLVDIVDGRNDREVGGEGVGVQGGGSIRNHF